MIIFLSLKFDLARETLTFLFPVGLRHCWCDVFCYALIFQKFALCRGRGFWCITWEMQQALLCCCYCCIITWKRQI